MRLRFVLAITLGCLAPHPASAQKVDMGTITCEAFLKAGSEFHGQVLMWLTGYYSEEDADAIIDFDKMAENGKKLGAYCAKNPAAGLMTAAKTIFE